MRERRHAIKGNDGNQDKPEDRREASRARRAAGPVPAAREDQDSLDDYVKQVVDALPPLTEEQRDMLALIFRKHRRLTAADREAPRAAGGLALALTGRLRLWPVSG
jgi:hypothetical protein